MKDLVDELKREIDLHRPAVHALLHRLAARGRPLLLSSELVDELEAMLATDVGEVLSGGALERIVRRTREAAIAAPWLSLAVRPRIAQWRYLRFHLDTLDLEESAERDHLLLEESIFGGNGEEWNLEIDLTPFERGSPKLRETRSIGRGVEFLNRHLSSKLFAGEAADLGLLVDFLRLHQQGGQALLLDPSIDTPRALRTALQEADRALADLPPETPWEELATILQPLGFLPGWGRDGARTRDTMALASQLLEAPDYRTLEALLARVPMICSVAILTPHGFFGQDGVLGLPDTGGQVVYILDQVRALENEMRQRLKLQGLTIEPQIVVITRLIPEARGTTCDQRLEPIGGTRNARILRVPFRSAGGEILRPWVSRFEIWPYLESFSYEVERELLAELAGRPDLLIGNYSDGALVATLLAQRLGITQCNISHALEKTKYLLSDLCWRDNEPSYHFSCQFTADLVAMNAADFIVASTYHEIAGTEDEAGQYESYRTFTMPGLMRVLAGIDVFDPKFNIVSPGADPAVYFPRGEVDRRLTHLHPEVESLLAGGECDETFGELANPELPLVFSMARLDRIKNLTGLASWYAASDPLQQEANLLIVGGHVLEERSQDREERDQIRLMRQILEQPRLRGHVRWLGARLDRSLTGELYRCIADRGGVFVQPALFEAFGLTVVEAMVSGLPTFATRYGGPLEIIEHGVSGFHIDPNHGELAAELITRFLAASKEDPRHWEAISRGGIERVHSRYTWELYAERLMTLSRVYGFWRFVSDLERQETRRYLDLLYGLLLRPRARGLRAG